MGFRCTVFVPQVLNQKARRRLRITSAMRDFHRWSVRGPARESRALRGMPARCTDSGRSFRVSDCLILHTTRYVALTPGESGVPELAVTAGTIR
jgi:hypothetical protein